MTSMPEQPACERTRRFRSQVEVDGQRIGYELYEIDARGDEQRSADVARQALGGELIVIIPGHGQTADTAMSLLRTSAAASKAGVAWAVDIDPPAGGDPVKAKALPAIVCEHAPGLFSGSRGGADSTQVKAPEIGARTLSVALFGWSHGGAEALRTAEYAPGLISSVTCLCPTGLVERRGVEIALSFVYECIWIVLAALAKGLTAIRQVLAIGAHILRGILGDAVRTRSPRRLLNDARWATHRVSCSSFSYPGRVALIFAAQDRVIRCRDVFPGCASTNDVASCLDAYRRADFPCVSALDVLVLPGNHASPETDPVYALSALEMIGELRGSDRYY